MYQADQSQSLSPPERNEQGNAVFDGFRVAIRRVSRYPIVGGLVVWTALLSIAYLVGTLAIAPMISEAAGIGNGVYSIEPSTRTASAKSEPLVQISPVSAPQPSPAVAPIKIEETKHKRKRRHRQELPPDAVFLSHRRGSETDRTVEEPSKHESGDDEQKDFGNGGEDRGAGDDSTRGVQEGQTIGDG